jgi:hypothetical protein
VLNTSLIEEAVFVKAAKPSSTVLSKASRSCRRWYCLNNNKNRNNNTVKNMCQNPFFPCQGKTNRTTVIIRLKNQDHEICEDCWNKLAESDIEWGDPLPEPYFGPFPQNKKLHGKAKISSPM